MKINVIAKLALCVFFPLFLSAQEYNSFDLNTYYTPDIKRNSLDLSFSTANNYNSNTLDNYPTKSNRFSWIINPEFTNYINTRKRVSTLNFKGGTNGEISNVKNSHSNEFSDNILAVNYSISFYSKKKQFLKLGLNSAYEYNYNRNKYTNDAASNNLSKKNNFLIKPMIAVGVGRVESVRDARQALYILDELSKRNQLSKKLTNEEIFQFAQTISQVKNKRFLDSRLRKIDEISTVDSFLVSNKFLASQSATYFTTLYDFWENGDLFERNSGKVLEFNFTPSIRLADLRTENVIANLSQETKEYYGQFNLTYSHYKQLHQNWQQSLSTGLGLLLSENDDLTKSDMDETLKNYTIEKEGQINIGYNLNYFPSTRTRFAVSAFHKNSLLFFDNTIVDNNEMKDNNLFQSYSNINASADYYFSPQLRISGNFGIGYTYVYNKNLSSNNDYFGVGAGVTINYSFF